jgi:glycosyltransferase involved in cell wall biosynthesis
MKIVFNTSQPHAACSLFYIEALKGIKQVDFFNAQFENYDIALFMTYDHQIIKSVREKFPNLKIGIIDPRSNVVAPSTQYCDFVVIDSIEMEDYWRLSGKPIFRYVEYPNIPYYNKAHEDKQAITVGYHGNLIHLDCMSQNVTPALQSLGLKYDIELLVMYNGPSPTGKEVWYPKNVKVRHVPWSMENYINHLALSDIGIAPNNLTYDNEAKKVIKTKNNFNYNDDDYLIRFKMPSNPGRIVVFGKLGIPVIADFYPSALQYLKGDIGYVAHSAAGWEYCLEQLITSSKKRQTMGNSLQQLVRNKFDFEVQNKKFLSFLGSV